ncbi:MAG: VWA domain-containing protein, partial [Bryobacteraceae bacterium]
GPSIKVDVDVVSILCTVRDKRGGIASNLTKDDFTVFEDGKQQAITYFARETDLPLTIGLLVDVSGSQVRLIEDERHAASLFFQKVLRKKDMAFLISFGAEAELLQDFTNSPRLLQSGLDRLRANSGVGGLHPGPVPTAGQPRGTVMFDAVYLAAADQLKREVGRKAVVLITDGVDVGSRLKREAAIEAAQKSDVILYGIYYVDHAAYYGGGFIGGASDADLRRMTDDTGGRVMRVDRRNSLQDIFAQLQEELRSQYAIGFTPANPRKDGSFRKLEVKVRDKNLKVQTRKGYFATSQ